MIPLRSRSWLGCMTPTARFDRFCLQLSVCYRDCGRFGCFMGPPYGHPLDDWLYLVSTMEELNLVALSRRVFPSGRYRVILHGFCDVSVRRYVAAVHLRTSDLEGRVQVILLLYKSKVAPMKTRLTIHTFNAPRSTEQYLTVINYFFAYWQSVA